MKSRTYCLLPFALVLASSSAFSQVPIPKSSGEIALALNKVRVLGSVLFVAAHPDDENTAFLATMANGRSYRTAYLSMTRGEGGQNLLGPEQSELMGVIRTQELLAARRIDGAEQFFTRAIDFGYSKSSEETIRFWGREKVLADVVWVIRTFRPDVIVTRFTPTLGTHGNHLSSAIFANEAFRLAGDSTKFPEQLRFVKPWRPKRIVWNMFGGSQNPQAPIPPNAVALDLGTYNPLLGKSYTEISGESRSMHKSQGFGAPQNRGVLMNYFQHVDGDTARSDLFDGVNTSWSRVKGGDEVRDAIEKAIREFDPARPAGILPSLFNALTLVTLVEDEYWRVEKIRELQLLILSCSGISLDAWAASNTLVPGMVRRDSMLLINRSDVPFRLTRVSSVGAVDTMLSLELKNNVPVRFGLTAKVPGDAAITQPYWLVRPQAEGTYSISDQTLIGRPENSPAVVYQFRLETSAGEMNVDVPLRNRVVDPVAGEQFRPVQITPPVAVNLEEAVHVFPSTAGKMIRVVLKAGMDAVAGTVRLHVPNGWNVQPAEGQFSIAKKNDEQAVSFLVTPSVGAASGKFSAEARVGNTTVRLGIRQISYEHIPLQTVYPVPEGTLLRMDVQRRGQNIAYIMGAGDDIPAALRQLGYSVTLLSDEELAEGNLSKFDAIVAGVRAYNTRPKLRLYQKKLMEYTKQGGTYVVQYATPQRGETENIGPYPLTISRDRVTEEDATMRFINPQHPLLNQPNKVSQRDFEGWTQERGLYFAGTWDAHYDTIFAAHDTGEQALAGGLLAAAYGEGYFVYNAFAFFRQLPAGVEGSYRLLANMVSLRKDPALKNAEVKKK